jgi:hypothetical protein
MFAGAASSSAIDVTLFYGPYCAGDRLICTAIDPSQCCVSGGNDFFSAGFFWIPHEWQLTTEAYRNGCADLSASHSVSDQSADCLTYRGKFWFHAKRYPVIALTQTHLDNAQLPLSSGLYRFRSRKVRSLDNRGAVGSECNPQKPNILVLADGQRYDISQLDDNLLKSLVEFTSDGTAIEGIPEAFKSLAIEGQTPHAGRHRSRSVEEV